MNTVIMLRFSSLHVLLVYTDLCLCFDSYLVSASVLSLVFFPIVSKCSVLIPWLICLHNTLIFLCLVHRFVVFRVSVILVLWLWRIRRLRWSACVLTMDFDYDCWISTNKPHVGFTFILPDLHTLYNVTSLQDCRVKTYTYIAKSTAIRAVRTAKDKRC